MPTKKAAKIKRTPRRRVTFRIEADPESDVRLAGSFNNWDAGARPLTRKDGNGTYSASLLLPPGRHEYKFIVNGHWTCDPACPRWEPNEHGTLNSVVEVC